MKQAEQQDRSKFYIDRLDSLNYTLKKLHKIRNKIAWQRFITVVLIICLAYFLRNEKWYFIVLDIIVGAGIFLKFVANDIKNNRQISNTKSLLFINEEEIKILNGEYTHRDKGINLMPLQHSYADDMDIFGNNSLYQYINRCNSQQGKNLLAQQLLAHQNKTRIQLQQEAVKELTGKPLWSQQFTSYGLTNNISVEVQQRINGWLQKDNTSFNIKLWNIVGFVFVGLTLSCLGLYIAGVFSYKTFLFLITLFFFVSSFCTKKLISYWNNLSKITNELQTMYQQLLWLQQEKFTSTHLKNIQQLVFNNNENATTAIQQLKKILDRGDLRLNVYLYFVLNTFFLWEVWQTIALIKWKKKYAGYPDKWFNAIAETELSISLSTLAFNHTQWCFPEMSDNYFTLKGTNIGHPLLSQSTCVANSFSTKGKPAVSIVTGSNMGGKSTFLRSIGCNMVLALMGSVVCAQQFMVYPAKLMSSMRIADNLAESTSTFYAELKKLKNIIQAVNDNEEIFILLDEILRGTNSLDKHKGSEALIKQGINIQNYT